MITGKNLFLTYSGENHPNVALVTDNYAVILEILGKAVESSLLNAKAAKIRSAHQSRNS